VRQNGMGIIRHCAINYESGQKNVSGANSIVGKECRNFYHFIQMKESMSAIKYQITTLFNYRVLQ
jgi:hypothetical protein